MKTVQFTVRLAMTLLTTLAATAAFAQSPALIAREACNLGGQADRLGEEIKASMNGSIFEPRLLNDAAELYQTAERIEKVADRNGNVRQMEADAKLLNIILERTDRTLTEAETFAIRNPHHGSARCRTHVVRNQVARMCNDVANLQRDLEVLCRMGNRPALEPHFNAAGYGQSSNWQSSNRQQGPYGSIGNNPWQTNYPPAITLNHGRFTLQFGR